jgi:hypothetical protein
MVEGACFKVRERGESASASILTFIIGMPFVMVLIVGFLFPLTVRAMVQKPIDALVDSYVDQYAAFGTLSVPVEFGGSESGDVRIDTALRNALVERATVRGDDVSVTCGIIEVDVTGSVSYTRSISGFSREAVAPVGSVVGCTVSGTIFSWPYVGPFMEAAPFLFGADYRYTSVAYVDQGPDPLFQ